MSVRNGVLIVFVGLALLTGCRSSTLTGEYAGRPTDTEWYTQYSLRHEKGRYRTTNYQVGLLLPINSKVVFVAGNDKRLKLRLENGTEVLVENMPQHTGDSMEQAFDELLGAKPVDLSQFSDDEREAILLGEVRLGMSREAVLAAMGHPPATGTPDMNQRTWKYWKSRWATFLVVFDDQWRVIECPE